MATSINLDIHIKNQQDLDAFNKRLDKAATELEQLAVAQGKAVGAFKMLAAEVKKNGAAIGTIGSSYKQLIADHQRLEAKLKSLNTQYTKQNVLQNALHSSTRGFAGAVGKLWLSYNQLLPVISSFTATMVTLKSLKVGTEFDYTTRYIDTISDSANRGAHSLELIQEKLLSIDGVAQGPNELASGLKEFAKAGVDVNAALAPLKNSLDGALGEMSRFATVAEMELGVALEFVIGQANAFADVGFVEAANQVSKAALSSSTSIQQMTEAMKNTTELGTVAGFKFAEVSTALALMASKGIRASQAGTSLRTSFLKMLAPSLKAEKIMARLGVHFSAIADDGKIKDMKTQIMELNEATKFLSEGDRTVLFKELTGLRSIKALGALMAVVKDGEAAWDEMADAIANAGDEVTFLQQKFNDLEESTKVQFEQLKASFNKALIIASNQETVRDVISELKDIVSSQEFKEGLNLMVTAFAKTSLYAAKFATTLPTIAQYTPAALYYKYGKEGFSYLFGGSEGDLADSKRKLIAEAEDIQQQIRRIQAAGFEQNGTMLYSPQQRTALSELNGQLAEVNTKIQTINGSISNSALAAELDRANQSATFRGTSFPTAQDVYLSPEVAGDSSRVEALLSAKEEYLRMEDQLQRTIDMNAMSKSEQIKGKLEEEVQRYQRLITTTEEYNKAQIDEKVIAYRNSLYASSTDLQKAYADEAKAVEVAERARLRDAATTQKYIDQHQKAWESLSKQTTSENQKIYKEVFAQMLLDYEQMEQGMDAVSRVHADIRVDALKKLMAAGYADAGDIVKAQKKLPAALKKDIDLIVKQLSPAAKAEYAQIKQGLYEAAEAADSFGKAQEKIRDQFIESAEASNSFVAGFAAGFLEVQEDFMTLGKVGKEVFNSLHDGWLATGDAIVEAAWTGDLGGLFDALRDTWSDTLQDMLKAFMRWLMELALQWAASGIVELVGSSLGLNLGGIGGGIGGLLGLGGVGNPISTAGNGLTLAAGAAKVADWLGIGAAAEIAPYAAGTGQFLGGGLVAASESGLSIAAADSMVAAMEEGAALIGASITEAATGVGASVNMGTQLALAEGTYGAGLGGTAAGVSAAAIGGMIAPFVIAPVMDAFGLLGDGYSRMDIPTGVEGKVVGGVVDKNEDGSIDLQEMQRNIRNSLESMQGYADAISKVKGATMEASQASALLEKSVGNAKSRLEVMAYQFGDSTAQMALALDGTTKSTDYFLDTLAGYNVSIDESARLNNLAQQAADGSSVAFEMLRNAMYQLTGNTEQARIATLGMISAVNELSNTPLSIDVQVNASTVGQAAIANTSVLGSSSVFDSDWYTHSKIQDSYDKGTDWVPKTGIYQLHHGERVMTPAENKEYTSGLGTLRTLDSKIDTLASAVAGAVEGSQATGPMTVVVQIGSKEIRRELLPIIDEEVTKQTNRGQLGTRTSY